MKKVLTVAIAVLALISFATLSLAAEPAKVKKEVVKGEVISIDTAKNEVVIKDKKTNADKTVVVDPKEIANIKKGEKVKAILKEGTNNAEKIKVYPAKKESTEKK